MPELKILSTPASESKLRSLVAGDEEMRDAAQQIIERQKLPYIILFTDVIVRDKDGNEERDGEGKVKTTKQWILRSSYSPGQLYLNKFITADPDTIALKDDAEKMAKSPHEVLIHGETGTGKELIAFSMIGDRKGQIKAVNCAGFPRELFESELFGHLRGSFTGAGETRNGLITEAAGGLMFMDEIGELPMEMQSKLLRVLQSKSVRKVGAKVDESVSCKFVFASNRSLSDMVKVGTFRKDLYARISTLELNIKPLSERRCDIIPIVESLEGGKEFLEKYRAELEEGLLDISLNVRSLQQYVIRYSVLGRVVLERK